MGDHEKGQKLIEQLFGSLGGGDRPAFNDMMELTCDYLFGEIWSREGLPVKDRSLITVAVLTATSQGTQLRGHLKGALNVGHSPEALREVMIHVAHYAGWPTGMNGLAALEEVMAEKGLSFSDAS
ncbi:MAG: carboxymuconolactone decarboxylase family protein [Pseudomonadota bacterium]